MVKINIDIYIYIESETVINAVNICSIYVKCISIYIHKLKYGVYTVSIGPFL